MSQQAISTSALGFPAIRLGEVHVITTSGSSQQTPAMNTGTTIFRIDCDQDVYVAVGIDPVASSSSFKLRGNYVEYFHVSPGEKIAVLQSTTSGTCQIVEGG